MDILFVFVAVCPALFVTGYELRGQEATWQVWVSKAAIWFYIITFTNFLLLYLAGWGSYDFTILSVQFLLRYMFSSMVIIGVVKTAKWAVVHTKEGDKNV